jgi:flagellar hook-basal body complex protein FliE
MVTAIGSAAIQEMLAQIRSTVDQTKNARPINPMGNSDLGGVSNVPRADFAQALKAHLNEVSSMEKNSNDLGKRFALGDNNVNLADVMISSQKANIALQSTVQVRNKLASAYQTIMNMQI